ncbi:tetratricopeptide repeat protein [Hippea maritima]|uniref:Tetratricopeptide repeat-like domain-containing protein n=1 Tax=Hippea maritima (strain ATCC 700847 / DSM 10411 / MH2) TaxID=760142 RepID=F2LWJ5_HIPMA|nr:hypothetical protein [Hippea maritima]AEA34104.1 hypothetical protein Hipma_1138 [Hippea maritima DSM 10411]
MSLIAKSLKRLEDNKKKKSGGVFQRKNSFDVFFSELTIYASLVVVLVLIFSLYSFKLYKKVEKQLRSKDFSVVEKLKNDIDIAEKKLKSKSFVKKHSCEYLLEIGKLNQMYEMAKKKNDIKYISIYYAKTNQEDKAIKNLKVYLKNHPNDEQAIAYLSYALMKKKKYRQALNELNKIRSDRYELFLDKAVIFELMGDMKNALKNYSIVLKKTHDKSLKNMIEAKIAVLRLVKD